jgi:peptide/nickel transport system ATP-binding protein
MPASHDEASAALILEVQDLEVAYRGPRRWPWQAGGRIVAVRPLSFRIARGETLALVGESGSGKSTTARAIEGLVHLRGGRILFEGRDVSRPITRRDPAVKQRLQIVFQNPDASLNPRHSVATLIGRPLAAFHGLVGAARRRRAAELLVDVHLDAGYLDRRPGQLSGGERQRVAIARALAAEPELLLCDEILSALDVSVQAGILALLRDLQRRRGLTYLFISHDLAVVRWLAHQVAVLYAGSLCEIGPVDRLFAPPFHPYTETLLEAVPRLSAVRGAAPPAVEAASAAAAGAGCPFAARCPRRIAGRCETVAPPWQSLPDGHRIRCHIPAAELTQQQSELALALGPGARPPMQEPPIQEIETSATQRTRQGRHHAR